MNDELNAEVSCPTCGTVYRGAAKVKVVSSGGGRPWNRGEDGVLLQPAVCVCNESCTLRRPDLGAGVVLVSTGRGPQPMVFSRATRTLYYSDQGAAFYRSGPRVGRERGYELGRSLWTGEVERLEAWALSLGGEQ
jgi:hypothetical protein